MDSVQKLYTHKASLYEWIFIHLIGRSGSLRQFLREGHYLKANSKVLDAGTGSGLLIKLLWQIAKEEGLNNIVYHGFDFTPAMLARFAKWQNKVGAANIALTVADAQHLNQLPSEWKNYDLIVSAGMLEYLPRTELATIIKNLVAQLKPGGQMILFISRKNWLTRLIIGYWWQAEVFTPLKLGQILDQVGLPYSRPRFPRLWSNFGTLIALINKPQ